MEQAGLTFTRNFLVCMSQTGDVHFAINNHMQLEEDQFFVTG